MIRVSIKVFSQSVWICGNLPPASESTGVESSEISLYAGLCTSRSGSPSFLGFLALLFNGSACAAIEPTPPTVDDTIDVGLTIEFDCDCGRTGTFGMDVGGKPPVGMRPMSISATGDGPNLKTPGFTVNKIPTKISIQLATREPKKKE